MKKLLALLLVPALVFAAGMSWARTFTTPTLDGIITGDGTDWDVCETLATISFDNADYTLWITWDEGTGVYIGVDRDLNPNNRFLGDNAGDISLFVAIDTDQTMGSGALSDGYSRVTFFPFSAHLPEYFYAFAGGVGWYEWATWDHLNGWWNWNGWTDQHTFYGWNNDVNIDDELNILWSDIGNPLGIAVYVWITNEGPGLQTVLAAWPEENPIGDNPEFPWAYEFYYGHYYCSPGVPAFCYQPACNICPDLTDHSVPVTLSAFTATPRNGAIEVSWTSQSEVNALAYHLLRSEMAEGEYENIASIEAHGNSETPIDYRYVDSDVISARTYYYKLADEDYEGNMRYHGPVFAAAGASTPGTYSLLPNYPNPFNPSTAIGYQIPQNGSVALTIYNVLGQEIRTLVNTYQAAGTYTVMWDGTDATGHHMNSGVYFYTIKAADYSDTRKMVLMR